MIHIYKINENKEQGNYNQESLVKHVLRLPKNKRFKHLNHTEDFKNNRKTSLKKKKNTEQGNFNKEKP